MIEYDPDILRTYAAQLYRQARHIEWKYATIGGLIGLALSLAIMSFRLFAGALPAIWLFSPILIGGYIGYSRGKAKAFWLRFQAQSVLVQAQIETNTRALFDRH